MRDIVSQLVSSLFSFIYSGPPAYGVLMPTCLSSSYLLTLTSLEASSQTHPRVCLLGDCKPSQVNNEGPTHRLA